MTRVQLGHHAGALFAVALAVLLAGWWSVAVPLYEILDEQWHVPYVLYLADGRGLPVQQADPAANIARQEGSQPPLYYALGAAIVRLIPRPPSMSTFVPNPHGFIGIPLAEGNKAMAAHGPVERFPWTGEPLAVHLVRFLSVLLAGVTVAGVYALALAVVPGSRTLATLSAVTAGCIPAFTFVSASVNNDNLINAVGGWALVAAIRAGRAPLSLRRSAVLGLLLGIALLAKLSGLALIPIIGLALLRSASSRRVAIARVLPHTAVVAAIAGLVAGWWYWRNWVLYGDPTGLSRMFDIVERRSQSPLALFVELGDLRFNFWALFGGVNILGPAWLYWFANGAAILGVVALAGALALPRSRRWLGSRIDWWASTLAVLWLAALFFSFLRWTSLTLATQGRLIYPALGVATLAFVGGLRLVSPLRSPRLGWALPALFAAGLLVGNVHSLIGSVLPEYAPPPRLPLASGATVPNPVDVRFAAGLMLVGYEIGGPRAGRHVQAAPGSTVAVTLYWRTTWRLDRNWSIFLHLLGDGERDLGAIDFYPGFGNWPTSFWDPAEIVVDRIRLPVRAGAPTPVLARLELGVYDLATQQRDPVATTNREVRGNAVTLDWIAIRRPLLAPAPIGQAPIQLEAAAWRSGGAELQPGDARPGQQVTADLTWRAGSFLPTNLTSFVQLVGETTNPATGNRVWAQSDHPAGPPDYPSSAWPPGDRVEDRHVVPVPERLPPGQYQWIAGLYDLGNGARWPVAASAGTGTEAKLGTLVVR